MTLVHEDWTARNLSEGPPPLERDDAHVWRIRLGETETATAPFDVALDAEEARRADRYFFERDRRRFAASRLAQRALLAGYCGVDARDISYRTGEHGKPALDGPVASPPHFSLSRSGDLALFAISRLGPVGVDVEAVEESAGLALVAEDHFAEPEKAALAAAAGDDRLATFYRIWTGKEAILKATGEGLTGDLRAIVVSAGPAAGPHSVNGRISEAAQWTLVDLHPAAGWRGAVAIRQRSVTIRTFGLGEAVAAGRPVRTPSKWTSRR